MEIATLHEVSERKPLTQVHSNAFIVDMFASEEQCAALRDAMDTAMQSSTHRGGYYLIYPDSPQVSKIKTLGFPSNKLNHVQTLIRISWIGETNCGE